MAQTPSHAPVSDAQKVLWRAELREVMHSEPRLALYKNMIDGALFCTAEAQSGSSIDLGAEQLIAYRHLVEPKYVIVVFEVLKKQGELGTNNINHAMVAIRLYAQASLKNGEPYVTLVISPDDHAPIEFICHATGCGSAIVNTTTVGLDDLLDRFPQQVENIMTQISFVTGLMPRAMGGTQ